ncbi:hypothetical protein CEXT_427141 [Caerostris extrusa]|uniref:Uncharacterized protein n=1 Tax=Caerostris extrusa TaxID=172846 RepID=A0AAV4RL29_CAEEX|nr:hypothetical protein CEXT_427141 [Caerostris extrusa]
MVLSVPRDNEKGTSKTEFCHESVCRRPFGELVGQSVHQMEAVKIALRLGSAAVGRHYSGLLRDADTLRVSGQWTHPSNGNLENCPPIKQGSSGKGHYSGPVRDADTLTTDLARVSRQSVHQMGTVKIALRLGSAAVGKGIIRGQFVTQTHCDHRSGEKLL